MMNTVSTTTEYINYRNEDKFFVIVKLLYIVKCSNLMKIIGISYCPYVIERSYQSCVVTKAKYQKDWAHHHHGQRHHQQVRHHQVRGQRTGHGRHRV